MNIVDRLKRMGGLRKEEFILLKALILANSFTINSTPCSENKPKDDIEKDDAAEKIQADSTDKIEHFRESLLSSLHDCMAVTRYLFLLVYNGFSAIFLLFESNIKNN